MDKEIHPNKINNVFRLFATKVSKLLGSPVVFAVAVLLILAWGVSGFFFHFNEPWQLFINTGTTIATFLIVFLIQNTQTRDFKSMNLKLDELVRGIHSARNNLMEIEEQSDEEIDALKEEYIKIRKRYMQKMERDRKKKKKKS